MAILLMRYNDFFNRFSIFVLGHVLVKCLDLEATIASHRWEITRPMVGIRVVLSLISTANAPSGANRYRQASCGSVFGTGQI